MSPFYIPSVSFLLLVSLALTSALPLQSTALTSEDLDVLKVKTTINSVYALMLIISIYA